MKRAVITIFSAVLMLLCYDAQAQKITNGSYQSVGYIKSDGTIQDGSYRTIGHAKGIPATWAAVFFFFQMK